MQKKYILKQVTHEKYDIQTQFFTALLLQARKGRKRDGEEQV